MSETLNVVSEGLVLDEILAKRFGPVATREARLVEACLERNPGLADTLTVPLGTVIELPDKPEPGSVPAEPVVDLFAMF